MIQHAHLKKKKLDIESSCSLLFFFDTQYFLVSPDGEVESRSGVEPLDLMDLALGKLNGEEL